MREYIIAKGQKNKLYIYNNIRMIMSVRKCLFSKDRKAAMMSDPMKGH